MKQQAKTHAFPAQKEADDAAGDHCDARGGGRGGRREEGPSVGRDVPIIGTLLDAAMDRRDERRNTRGT